MVGALKIGEGLAGQIIATSELFYNRRTQLRFLVVIRNVLGSKIEQLEVEDSEEETRDVVTGEVIYG